MAEKTYIGTILNGFSATIHGTLTPTWWNYLIAQNTFDGQVMATFKHKRAIGIWAETCVNGELGGVLLCRFSNGAHVKFTHNPHVFTVYPTYISVYTDGLLPDTSYSYAQFATNGDEYHEYCTKTASGECVFRKTYVSHNGPRTEVNYVGSMQNAGDREHIITERMNVFPFHKNDPHL